MDAGAADFLADPFGGRGLLMPGTNPDIRTWLHYRDDGVTEVCRVERVDPVLEANRALLNESTNKRFGDGQIVASLPAAVYWHGDYAAARKNHDQAWIKRFLNDSDNDKLRTFRGRL